MLTENPFPEDTEQDAWVKDAWQDACTMLKLSYMLPKRIKKMVWRSVIFTSYNLGRRQRGVHADLSLQIMSRTSHARGALKDCIRPMVATKYGFSSQTDEPTKAANRTLYEHLLDLNNPEGPEPIFHYQVSHRSPSCGLLDCLYVHRM